MMSEDISKYNDLPFLRGGGEMGALIRSFDWQNTALGAPEKWPAVLRQSVSMMLSNVFPVLICWGDNYTQLYNDAFRPINGADKHPQALGESFPHTYKDLWHQIGPTFEKVMEGESVGFSDVLVLLESNGLQKECYFDFSQSPIRHDDGSIGGILIICMETTERVTALKTQDVIQAINEELAASNEELALANEDLLVSEQRFRNLILQAPFAICIIRAQDLMVTEVNQGYLELIGRKREEILGHEIWNVVTEAAENYAPLLQEVINTGEPFYATEHQLILIRSGIPEQVSVDFVYEPVVDLKGSVISIMVVAIDVTDKVNARRNIEHVEERLRLAVEATEMATFDFDYQTGELVFSERFADIFQVPPSAPRNEVIIRYHPEDAHLSDEAHEKARTTGKMFFEARLLLPDHSIRWIRVHGNVYFDDNGVRKRTVGTVLDITEYRRLQQQKDDFISIASHELKTPITTLKASLQLLERMKSNPNERLPKLIEQSTKSMQKISELVEDLLNVSKMNHGHVALEKKRFRVANMIESCCSHIRQDGKYELGFEGDRELEIVADEHRIEQVLVNFVNNAVKYAPDSYKITLKAERLGNVARISVIDHGPGIAEDKLPHLFDRYFRADQSGTQISGLGLGLYICAEIIEKHDGKIGVDSIVGKGSTFWFELAIL